MPEDSKIQNFAIDSPEFLKYLEGSHENMRDFDNAAEAKQMAEILHELILMHPELADKSPEIYKAYQDLEIKYKLVAMPVLSAGEVLDVLENHLLLALKSPDLDIKRRFDGFLLTFSSDLDMARFIELAEKILEQSNTKIGSALLTKPEGEVIPTIANWIKVYFAANSGKPERGSFEQISFVTNDKNAQKLSGADKETLKKIRDCYDWLKFPHDDPVRNIDPQLEKELLKVAENAEKIVAEIVARRDQLEGKATQGVVSSPVALVPKVVPPPPVPPPPGRKMEYEISNIEVRKELPHSTLPPAPRPPKIESRIPVHPAGGENGEYGRKEGKIISEEPMAPRTSSLNEDLYRSTLDELKKQREEREPKISVSSTLAEAKIQSTPQEFAPQISGGQGQQKPIQPQPPRIEKPEIPKKPGFDENLYRSTLDELNKIRQAYEHPKEEYRISNMEYGKKTPESKPAIKPTTPNSTFPASPAGRHIPHSKPAEPPPNLPAQNPVSVNEAIVQAGTKPPPTRRGQIVAESEDMVEKKLKELEEKIK